MFFSGDVNSDTGERERLRALLGAIETPAAATALRADDPPLVKVARHHRLSPLLSALCGEALPAPLADLFRRDQVTTAARHMMLELTAADCLEALSAAGIPTIMLKGLAYQNTLYPTPGTRATSDIDLLVPHARRRDAFGVLDRLGFEPRAAAAGFDEPDYHEVAWTGRSVEIDLHLALAPFVRCDIDYDAVWRGAQPLRVGGAETRALCGEHAAIFHGLHMAIDHFAVPAIYLVDLARLLPDRASVEAAEATARRWRCGRPLATALALAAAFLPGWASAQALAPAGRIAARVVRGYGTTVPLARPEQLLRKVAHFDTVSDAIRYIAVQSRRNLRERWEKTARRRSPRERLAL